METFNTLLCQSRLVQLSDGSVTLEVPSIKGNIITPQNVSSIYRTLFSALVLQHQSGSQEMLSSIVDTTMNLNTFKVLIESVIQFYLSSMIELPTNSIPSAPPIGLPITMDLIIDTFYNIMVNKYLDNATISKDDLESCETYIFTALPAFVVFDIVVSQKDVKNGVRLCNGAIVTKENCPNPIKPLFNTLINLKNESLNIVLTNLEETHILYTISAKQINGSHVSPNVSSMIGKIMGIAIHISQMQHFKQVIGNVIEFLVQLS